MKQRKDTTMEKSLIDKTIMKPQDSGGYRDEATFGFERYADKMLDAHNRAVAKHPMTGMRCVDKWNHESDILLDALRKRNDNNEHDGKYRWDFILQEEAIEAVKEIADGNWDAAQAEAVQVAQVAFRMWLWCEEQKQKQINKAKKGE